MQSRQPFHKDIFHTMFTPTGLLKMVVCPGGNECTTINCIFSHEFNAVAKPDEIADSLDLPKISEPATSSSVPEPQAKRRKLSSGAPVETPSQHPQMKSLKTDIHTPTPSGKAAPIVRGPHTVGAKSLVSTTPSEGPEHRNSTIGLSKTTISQGTTPPSSTQTSGTPQGQSTAKPAAGDRKTTTPDQAQSRVIAGRPANVPAQELRPRAVKDKTISVAQQLQRKTYLKHIFAEMKRLNGVIVKSGNKDKANLVINEATMTQASIEAEYDIAQGQLSTVYSNHIRRRIAELKRMKLDDWANYVREMILTKDGNRDKHHSNASHATEIKTGLSVEQELEVLRTHLLVPIDMLKKMDYVLQPPTAEEIEGVPAARAEIRDRLLKCDRCKTTFRVDPDRLEGQENLTTNGPCCSHWGKLRMPAKVTNNAPREPAWTCCGRDALSTGCTETKSHVYKLHGPIEHSYTMPFINTPSNENPLAVEGAGRVSAIAFDCEMAYTVFGMEVVRLTAVAWPGNQPMIDVLVRPKGTMLDFNSRFSGVRAELFEKAYAWKTGMSTVPRQKSEDESAERPLPIVSSPEVARSILCSYMTPDTVLLGHGLENDLNALRLCHDKVVDTAALYPHPAGLPIRYGLKQLAFTHLNRDIQTGGASGHDSLEDAVASGDLVRIRVAKKARELKARG